MMQINIEEERGGRSYQLKLLNYIICLFDNIFHYYICVHFYFVTFNLFRMEIENLYRQFNLGF